MCATCITLISDFSGEYEENVIRLKSSINNRLKDADSKTRVLDDLYNSCGQLAHAARMAMVAMLQVNFWVFPKLLP